MGLQAGVRGGGRIWPPFAADSVARGDSRLHGVVIYQHKAKASK